jgi:hypothetical protein
MTAGEKPLFTLRKLAGRQDSEKPGVFAECRNGNPLQKGHYVKSWPLGVSFNGVAAQ